MPGKPPIRRSLFCYIANNITGGGKQQEAGLYQCQLHNFAIVNKIIYALALVSDLNHTLVKGRMSPECAPHANIRRIVEGTEQGPVNPPQLLAQVQK